MEATRAMSVLIVFPCGLISARFLFQPGFPYSDDGLNHLIQLTSFRISLAHGDLYPRWSPLLNQQYGSPLFSYYAPLPFYVAAIGARLGTDVTASLRFVFAAGVLVAGLTMYLLGRELGGRSVGVAAGAAFATLPYLLHDVYSRAELGETLALAVLPAILFGLARYARTRARGWLGLAAAGVASLPLTHNISALMDLPFVVLWALLMALAAGRGDGTRPARSSGRSSPPSPSGWGSPPSSGSRHSSSAASWSSSARPRPRSCATSC